VKSALLIAYKAFADIGAKGSLFVITIVAARRLGPQMFGVFSLASTLGWMLAVATDFGIQLHLARAVARGHSEATLLLNTWLRVRLWTAGGAIVVVALGLAALRPSGPIAAASVLFTLIYVVGALVEFLNYFYRGLGRTEVESSLTLWQRFATLACALLALAWRPDLTVLGVAMLLPMLATFAVSLWIAARLARSATSFVTDARPVHQPRWVEFRRDVMPIGAGIVLSALYFRIDLFLVELWLGTGSVAQYNAVFRLVEALRLFPAAVLAVVLPSLCRAGDAGPLVRVSLGVTAFAGMATLILWATAAWTIPLLYGAPFAAAVPAFRVLILSFPLLSLNYALTHQLIGWDRQRAFAILCGIALVVNVALNTRLIPALQIEGAAWATLWTEVFLTVGCVVVLWTGRADAPARVPAGAVS
jgi:O-antigen/teichoic acid export membrane protein